MRPEDSKALTPNTCSPPIRIDLLEVFGGCRGPWLTLVSLVGTAQSPKMHPECQPCGQDALREQGRQVILMQGPPSTCCKLPTASAPSTQSLLKSGGHLEDKVLAIAYFCNHGTSHSPLLTGQYSSSITASLEVPAHSGGVPHLHGILSILG